MENIRPFSLRELTVMARSRQRAEWERTSMIVAMIYNMQRDPKQCRQMEPDEFNPYVVAEDSERTWSLAEIKTVTDREGVTW